MYVCMYMYTYIHTHALASKEANLILTDFLYLKSVDEIGFSFTCLVGVRARTLHKQVKEKPESLFDDRFPDDCVHRFSSKEQQRLSSK